MTQKPVVVVLHGPSGVGKDAVINRLREKTGISRATSSTSREPRDNETEGIDYYFLSEAEFEQKIAAGEFAEHARVYDQWKGVEMREVRRLLDSGADLIIRTDVQGARRWRELIEGAVFVFLMAESRDVLRARLIDRNTEDARELAIRIEELEKELDDMPNNDHVVINHHGKLEAAVSDLEQIIEDERQNPDRPKPSLAG